MGQGLQVVEQFWTRFEQGDLGGIDAFVHRDCETVMPGGVRLCGPDQLLPMLQAYCVAFPDLHHEILDAVESGDALAVELRVSATHTGDFVTPGGTIPATGRRVVWESVDFIRLRDGKLVSWHAYLDRLAFLEQLGLVPPPG